MYVIFDAMTVGPFNDYESAQMFVLYSSEDLFDGGESLTIEPVTEAAEWAMDNNLNMAIATY